MWLRCAGEAIAAYLALSKVCRGSYRGVPGTIQGMRRGGESREEGGGSRREQGGGGGGRMEEREEEGAKTMPGVSEGASV